MVNSHAGETIKIEIAGNSTEQISVSSVNKSQERNGGGIHRRRDMRHI